MRDIDRFRGSLIGGAAGDALGYEVEFWSEEKIFSRYGKPGITEYELHNGKALISDDTQMTLFTATGLLIGTTRGMTRGVMGARLGMKAIPEKYTENLELKDVILEVADDLCNDCQIKEYGKHNDLCNDCQIKEYGKHNDPVWVRKYIEMSWRGKEQ